MNAAGLEPTGHLADEVTLLDQVGQTIRLKHYSIRTEESYVGWVQKCILFQGKRPGPELSGRMQMAALP